MPVQEAILYGGDVKISFEENKRTGTHSYVKALKFPDGTYTDWQPTHGITAPLEMVPKPYLMPWASKLGVHAALEYAASRPHLADEILQCLQDIENELDKTDAWAFKKKYGKWLSPLKSAYRNASQEGKNMGTWLHGAVETWYNTDRGQEPILDPSVQPMWTCFREFDNYYKPKVEATEFFVYSKLFGYSGQGDMKGELNGKQVIADWKTSNRSSYNKEGIEVTNFYQLGGLAQAQFEEFNEWVDDLVIVNIDKKGGEPAVVFASDFGMSVQDAAKAYIGVHNAYHTLRVWENKYSKKA